MRKQLLATVGFAVLLGACAADPGSPQAILEAEQEIAEYKQEIVADQVDDIPDWFIDPPVADMAVYAVGSARSTNLDMALTKATLSAKRQLADRLSGELTEKIREFASEIGEGDNLEVIEELERATANVVRKTAVHGYRVADKEIQPALGGRFQVYILLEYGSEEINKVLKRKLQDERTKTKNKRKKELFEQLEKELDREA